MHKLLPALLVFACVGCASHRSAVEGTSLLGEPLVRPQFPTDVFDERQADVVAARKTHEADQNGEDAAIWHGRRLAYLGRYRDAITVYSEALAVHPHSFRLLRHRGHRYITVRQLDDAITDLQRAAELAHGLPDEVEPDGMPNALGIPTSTTKTNIWYHLGLAHYLQHDFVASAEAYMHCLALATNDDTRCAASYWLYLSLVRLDRNTQAQAVLDRIGIDMNVIENHAYHELLLTFKGDAQLAAKLTAARSDDGVENATVAYGLAAKALIDGNVDEAMTQFKQILTGDSWGAFGYIAAEAEIAHQAEE